MVDIVGFYNSLLSATFGGVPFNVVDTSQEVGRRVQRFLFPGVDAAAFQDLGADAGPIMIRGILVGADYITQMQAMIAVFNAAGPYQLVHPWLGTMQVVPVDGQRPRFELRADQLQVCRFEMAVYPYVASSSPSQDTLSVLGDKLDTLTADMQNWLAAAMTPLVGAVAAFGYIQSFLNNSVGIFTNVVSLTASAGEIGPAVSGELAGLTGAITAPVGSFPSTASAAVAALMGAWAGSATPTQPSAVAPGGTTTPAPAADPTDVVTTLLTALPSVVAQASGPAPAPALSAGLQAAVVGAAVQAASNISYASQQDAIAMAEQLFDALDQAIGAAATAAASDPLNAPTVWRDLVAVKAALAADMNVLIGRLPEVVTINTPRTMPVWLLAQYVSGDDPSSVFATWQDIIARNNVRHPAMLQAGPVEVLNQ